MLTFKNHCGQFHKTNTALVALTSLYVIGGAVALSAPYWVSSTSMLAPLAAFAATPLGIGVLAFVAIALTSLAISAIFRNNKISELKAPRMTKDGLLVTRDVYEEMKKNNQVKDGKGNVEEGKYCLEGKNYRIIVVNNSKGELGNTLLFEIDSLEVKSDKGEFEKKDKTEWDKTLGLDKDGAKEFNTYLEKADAEKVAKGNVAGKN